jgi:large subunit ribosomal protein L17
MPKPKKGPRLGGSAAHQRHIIANLCKDLVRKGSVRTTMARAKTVQPHMERLITKAKKGDTHNRRQILQVVQDREIAYLLVEELAPLFEGREGGYTRIIPVGNRKGDNAPMAVISLVTEAVTPKVKKETPVVADEVESAESAEEVEEVLDDVEDAAEEAEEAESAASPEEAEEADGDDADEEADEEK